MNLSSIDLNLLLVLHAMLEDPSVARNAQRLHVTPPAISNALARLRATLGDPLFVRSGRGLVATPRALEVAPALAAAIAGLERVVERAPESPAQTTRELTIALSDADQLATLPTIVAAFAHRMPRARLRVISVDALIAGGGLEAGAADVAIGPADSTGAHFSAALYEEEAVFVVRKGHPRARGRVTPAQFAALRHVDVQIALGRGGAGNRAAVDGFERFGMARDIAITVPSFVAAAMVVASTDLVTGLPRRLVNGLALAAPLVALRAPMPTMTFDMRLHWHERTDADPVARLFREVVVGAIAPRNAPARRVPAQNAPAERALRRGSRRPSR